ncbi:hypothetical protein OC709_02550 ['Planchonia careya' phytoplasma]|nr:hypothetical protein ['Planchonia careya' phytoplasma]MDO8030370.1 hypothetical protein ['Planchonia careya' phytoplasma]
MEKASQRQKQGKQLAKASEKQPPGRRNPEATQKKKKGNLEEGEGEWHLAMEDEGRETEGRQNEKRKQKLCHRQE